MNVFSVGILAPLRNLRDTCAGKDCRVSRLRNPLMNRKTGIRLGNEWFCGDECFRQVLEIRIRQMRKIASTKGPRRKSRLPLGLLLLSRGCITNAQLAAALDQQRQLGGTLGQILCEMNFVTEQEVASAAATQWGCPVFRPKSSLGQVQARIPTALMNMYTMVPAHYSVSSNKLLVGFVHRIEHQVLQTIEDITCCITEPCVITCGHFRETIYHSVAHSNDVTFDGISSAAEIARIAQSYASQIGAEEARIGVCRDYVWVRLNREDYPTDLLFSISGDPSEDHNVARN